MTPFAYVRPASIDDAIARRAADPGSAYLAGGTNLVDHLRLGIATPSTLIDLTRLPADAALDGIEPQPDGALRIGARVRNADLAADRRLREGWPFVAQALLAGASGQIRNAATTAGNLLQRTRCVYFQDASLPCNKRRPGSGCPAQDGFGRFNAILGLDGEDAAGAGAACVAVHPSDFCVPLAALDATLVVRGPGGERRMPFGELHRLPAGDPSRDTTLGAAELIVALELPASRAAVRSAYRKIRERASYAFALVSVAAAVELAADGTLADVRLAFGGAAHRPWRAHRAEALLRGRRPDETTFGDAADVELAAARPGQDNAYKVPMLRAAIVATLSDLVADGSGR